MISFDAFWAPREERGGEPGEVRGLVYASTPSGGLRVLGRIDVLPRRFWGQSRGLVRLTRTTRAPLWSHEPDLGWWWVPTTTTTELPLASLGSIPAALDFFRDPL